MDTLDTEAVVRKKTNCTIGRVGEALGSSACLASPTVAERKCKEVQLDGGGAGGEARSVGTVGSAGSGTPERVVFGVRSGGPCETSRTNSTIECVG